MLENLQMRTVSLYFFAYPPSTASAGLGWPQLSNGAQPKKCTPHCQPCCPNTNFRDFLPSKEKTEEFLTGSEG